MQLWKECEVLIQKHSVTRIDFQNPPPKKRKIPRKKKKKIQYLLYASWIRFFYADSDPGGRNDADSVDPDPYHICIRWK